jgi:hypothetical protein
VDDVQDVIELEKRLVNQVAAAGSLCFVHAYNLQARGLPTTRSNRVQ